ncbi:hypothetical protein [Neptuniibacter sp. QD37_11]|uniref:hypothetical protein n=1 Tax=Neptuniibacter sp. QD37_11 TaxID=3398209 RepID=UPI0039F60F8D
MNTINANATANKAMPSSMLLNTGICRARFIEIRDYFRSFIKDKDNHPYYCEDYGTKYPGKVTYEHFIFYAILKGKDPKRCSHDPDGERFKEAMECLREPFAYTRIVRAFHMSDEEVKVVLSSYFQS